MESALGMDTGRADETEAMGRACHLPRQLPTTRGGCTSTTETQQSHFLKTKEVSSLRTDLKILKLLKALTTNINDENNSLSPSACLPRNEILLINSMFLFLS